MTRGALVRGMLACDRRNVSAGAPAGNVSLPKNTMFYGECSGRQEGSVWEDLVSRNFLNVFNFFRGLV